jgi:phosphotransferase system enzyme I (PtsI)
LLGLGLDEFSMNPFSIPKVKKVLRMVRFSDTRALVEQTFQFSTAGEIKKYIRSWMTERFPPDITQHYKEEWKS